MKNANCPITVFETGGSALLDYKEAFYEAKAEKTAYFLISDNNSQEFLSFVKSELQKDNYRLFISAAGDTPTETAKSLNFERMILCCPALVSKGYDLSAAVCASMLIRDEKENPNLWLAVVNGDYELSESQTEEEKNNCLKSGVTVFESGSYGTEVIRAVTTRTKNASGAPDSSYRNVSVPLTADRVITSLKELLDKRLQGTGRGKTTLGSIKSLVECYFITALEEGLISSYEKPRISLSEDDKSVCLIGISFTIFEGIAQIYMNAEITV